MKNKKLDKKIDDFIDRHIVEENIETIMSERFAEYSKYTIQDRALPDARDGLKPVQRRILYGMNQMKLFHDKGYKKSARIVGEVMGKYHPHGDQSIYEAMVRLSQDWKMAVMLVDMQGNNGSIDGDGAAAMRYTEARLSEASYYLLSDINKQTVPFVPNFDDEELEPTVLPAKFCNLLVNGAVGVSSGYATKIPPHNINEVIDATIEVLKNPDLTTKKIMKYIKGPDFPTGGIVQGKDEIYKAFDKGIGKVVIRSKTKINNLTRTQEQIIITEIPYEVNKADLIRQIDLLRIDKKVEDILEIRDESDREGLQIAIDLKKGADSQAILDYLLKNTDLQINYNYNIVAILNNKPLQVGIIPILKAYCEHYKEVVTNRSNYLLKKAKKREHIVLGLIRMVSILDDVVRTIRHSENKQNAKENIMREFGFSEIQAEAIVMLQLYRLTNTDIVALEKESKDLKLEIFDLERILTNEDALKKVIEDELLETKNKLNMRRKTQLEEEIETIKINEEALISEENVMVGITKDGYVVRSNLRSYSTTQTSGLKENDSFIFEKEVSTIDTLIMFTNKGNYIYYPIYKLEEQRWGDLGIYINNIVPIDSDEKIIKVYDIKSFDTPQKLLLATKSGMMKQINLSDLKVQRYSRSLRCMKLDKGDSVVSVSLNALENIICVSKEGYLLLFLEADLPDYGLQAKGVIGMQLKDGDELTSACYVNSSDDFYCLTSRGNVIKDSVNLIPTYNRARRGIRFISELKSNPHYLVSIARLTKNQVKQNVKVRLISEKGSIDTNVNDLRYTSNKYGFKAFDENKLGKGLFLFPDILIEDQLNQVKAKIPTPTIKKQVVVKAVSKTEKKEEKKIVPINRLGGLFGDDDF